MAHITHNCSQQVKFSLSLAATLRFVRVCDKASNIENNALQHLCFVVTMKRSRFFAFKIARDSSNGLLERVYASHSVYIESLMREHCLCGVGDGSTFV